MTQSIHPLYILKVSHPPFMSSLFPAVTFDKIKHGWKIILQLSIIVIAAINHQKPRYMIRQKGSMGLPLAVKVIPKFHTIKNYEISECICFWKVARLKQNNSNDYTCLYTLMAVMDVHDIYFWFPIDMLLIIPNQLLYTNLFCRTILLEDGYNVNIINMKQNVIFNLLQDV
jgi:hypothetical protein